MLISSGILIPRQYTDLLDRVLPLHARVNPCIYAEFHQSLLYGSKQISLEKLLELRDRFFPKLFEPTIPELIQKIKAIMISTNSNEPQISFSKTPMARVFREFWLYLQRNIINEDVAELVEFPNYPRILGLRISVLYHPDPAFYMMSKNKYLHLFRLFQMKSSALIDDVTHKYQFFSFSFDNTIFLCVYLGEAMDVRFDESMVTNIKSIGFPISSSV